MGNLQKPPGSTIKEILSGLCERHGINGAAVDLFLVGGDKVLCQAGVSELTTDRSRLTPGCKHMVGLESELTDLWSGSEERPVMEAVV